MILKTRKRSLHTLTGGTWRFLPHGWGLTSSADAFLPLGLNPELHGILEAQAQV